MKTISLAEFEALVARNDWQHVQEHDVVDRFNRQVEEWCEESKTSEHIDIPHAIGWASKVSTNGCIKITYIESFNYDEYNPESLVVGTEGQEDVWSIEGVLVVDEDGDELNVGELAELLHPDFSSIDYSVLEIEQVANIDVDEGSGMQAFELRVDNAPSVRFMGELVASAASSDNRAWVSNFSGQAGRWTELALYKTKGGKFICYQVLRTRWQGDRDKFSCKVCEMVEGVKEFFGYDWLAKELYVDAGIGYSVEVE